MSVYLIAGLILALLVFAFIKKKNPYGAFVKGAKGSFDLVLSVFPYLAAIFLMTELLAASGIMPAVAAGLAPVFSVLGVPKELTTLVIIKPFSGSGSMAVLSDIYATYTVDSYISRVASCVMGASDTLFYIIAVYFSKTRVKRLLFTIPVALIAHMAGVVVACFICKFF